MRRVKCVNASENMSIKIGDVYQSYGCSAYYSGSDFEYTDVILNGNRSGPWFKDRFIDVSFNEYLNRLK